MNIQSTLKKLGLDPKKSLGQNFMVEPSALARMVEAADLTRSDTVLEIGAGLGALTDVLANQAHRVVSLEIDGRFIPYLRDRYSVYPHVEIVEQDILEADIPALLGEDAADYCVIANVPYYITSAIIRHLLESPTPPRQMVITVQHEVAQRITAQPGKMSILAVSVQVYGIPKIVSRLKRGIFYPPPNIESAILSITPHPEPLITQDEVAGFFRIVRAGFAQPRKQIKNTLAAGTHRSSAEVVAWLEDNGIDPRRRAETLTVEEWITLYRGDTT